MNKAIQDYFFSATKSAFNIRMNRITCVVLALISTLSSDIQAKDLSVLILSSSDKPYINVITQNISNQLANSDIQVKKPNSYEITNANQHDLIITIGSESMNKALQNTSSTTPVYSLLIPKSTANNLSQDNHRIWAAQVIDQPFDRQLLMIKHLFGQNKKIGVLLGPVSSRNRAKIEQAARNLGLTINFSLIQKPDELIPALKETINNNDILLSVPDPVVYSKNTIRGILLLTYRNKTPVVGFSRSYVKAGATASLYSTPEQIAADAAENIKKFFLNNRKFTRKEYNPESFSIETNNKVIKAMKLQIHDKDVIMKLIRNQ